MNVPQMFLAILMLAASTLSFAQTIIDPVDIPFFVINRKTASVSLPKDLGGKDVKGFAGLTITVDSSGKVRSTEIKKLKLSGKLNVSYQSGYDNKSDIVIKYETFLKKYGSKIKIVKTDKRKPPKVNTITFLVRF